MTLNALMACDKVIVPIQVEFFAVEGLKVLIRMLDELGELGYQPKRRYLLTMCDNRRKITEEVSSKIRDLLGDAVFDVVIPENVRLVLRLKASRYVSTTPHAQVHWATRSLQMRWLYEPGRSDN